MKYFLLFLAAMLSLPLLAHSIDEHHLPLGDGKISTSPQRGYVFACQTQFHGHGADVAGNWIHGNSWDATEKIAVQGNVLWPDAQFTVTEAATARRVVGNGLPVQHSTGIFPILHMDPAYQIDRNPNTITAQQISLSLPLHPELLATPSCVGMGMIGISTDGVAIFNALDAEGRDAVAHEVQDHCDGHPQQAGQYHYHGPSPCIQGVDQRNVLVGYALDGFGIYSRFDEVGKELSNEDLDECHGRTSPVLWDGKRVPIYHYVMTREYPYTVGCFRGAVDRSFLARPEPQGEHQRSGIPLSRNHQPPPEAINACQAASDNAHCEFISPRGDPVSGACRRREAVLACVPDQPPRSLRD